jgi:hypothetical protein
MSSADARALAETFAGADPDRAPEADPPESSGASAADPGPSGIEPADPTTVAADPADQGPRVLALLRDRLGVLPEWSIDEERAFTWWPGRLALTVRAEPPIEMHGLSIVRVRTTTRLLRDIPTDGQTARKLSHANAPAGVDGLVWDPDARTLDLVTEMWCHAENAWLDPLVYSAAGLQVSIAESSVDGLRETFGGEVAASEHPTSGPRTEPDELIDASAAFAAAGDRSTPFTEGDLRALARSPLAILPFAVHGSDTLTAEVPFHSERGVLADLSPQDRVRALVEVARRERTSPAAAHEAAWLVALAGPVAERPGTALVRLSFGERHPDFGAGLAMTLRIPVRAASEEAAAELAAVLDRRELVDVKLAPFVGAWHADGDALVFAAFFPVALARGLGSDDRQSILATFAAWLRERSRWAASVAPELAGRWPVAMPRLDAQAARLRGLAAPRTGPFGIASLRS